MKRSPSLYFGLLPVLLLFALVIGAYLFPSPVRVYEPTFLLPILNTVLFLAACVIAYIARRIYLINGSITILWIGCGVLTLAVGALTAGWLIIPFGPNVNVTIFNVGVFLSALCHLGAVAASLGERSGEADPSRRKRQVRVGYAAVLVGMALLVVLTITGHLPPFFIQGQGPTVIRQNVAGWAVVLFTVSCLFTMNHFRRRKASFLYWYSLALALLALAMLAFLLQPAVGSPIGWLGRSSYVLAAVYFLISVYAGLREARTPGANLSQMLTGLLGPQHYRALFDNLNDSMAIDELLYDDQGKPCDWRILEINPAYLQATGKNRGDIVGRRLSEIYGLDRAPEPFLSRFAWVVQTGEPVQVEGYFEPLRRQLLISAFHLGGSRFATLTTDITTRKRAEAALRESEKHYRSLFNNMLNGFAYCQMHFEQDRPVDFTYLEVNEAFEDLTGLKNVVGKKVSEVIPGIRESDPELLEIYGKVALTGIPERFESYIEALGMWFSISVYSPKKEHFVAVFDVITERKRAEEALRRLNEELEHRVQKRTAELKAANEQLLREVEERHQAEKRAESLGRLYRLLSKVNEMIVRAREPEWLFQQACRIMMEEGAFLLCWIGRVDWEARVLRAAAQFDLGNDYPQNITISIEDVPEGRGPSGVAVREGRWDVCLDIANDPRMAPWRNQALARGFRSSAAFPLFVGGKVAGVLTLYSGQTGFFNQEEVGLLNSLAQDLSFAMESMEREAGRRQAEAEIRRLNEELEQRVKERTAELEFANRELESFSYSVSHDLKAPIRAIQGFSRMLAGEHAARLDEEALRLLNVIVDNTQTMAKLIDDLLALSRLGRQQLRKSAIDLAALARQVFGQLRELEPERNLQLTVPELPEAWGDPALIKQVVMNLLDNAIKYTRARKTATIEVGGYTRDGDTVYFVKDNGVGFDKRYAQKLFGVFQRLHGGSEYEGTGVGLAIVQRIIQRHGGRVWAEGKVGAGATFYFSLPQ